MTLMCTTTRAAREPNPLYYFQQWEWSRVETIQPRRHIPTWNNEKYVARRSNCVTTGKKILNKLQNSTNDCTSTSQFRWNAKRLFKSNTGIFIRSWVQKNTPSWIDLFNLSILKEHCLKFNSNKNIKHLNASTHTTKIKWTLYKIDGRCFQSLCPRNYFQHW